MEVRIEVFIKVEGYSKEVTVKYYEDSIRLVKATMTVKPKWEATSTVRDRYMRATLACIDKELPSSLIKEEMGSGRAIYRSS